MSTWYDATVTAYGEEDDLAKLLGLKPEDSHGIHKVEMSFGQKNGVDLRPLIKNNPELVFFIHMTVESFSGGIRIARYDRMTDSELDILLESYSYDMVELNKKILEDYPELIHQFKKEGHIDWKSFCSDEKRVRELLNQADQYEELASLIENQELDFDNEPLEEA